MRDWAVGQAGGICYSQAALSSNDSNFNGVSKVPMTSSFLEVSSFRLRAPYMSGPPTALSLSPEGNCLRDTPSNPNAPEGEREEGKEREGAVDAAVVGSD